MSENKFFTAIYQDGKVQMSGQWFDAGSFAVHLLNQFYENDTAARLSVFCMGSDFLLANLKSGFLDKELFRKAGWEYQQILKMLPALKPFDLLDLQSEQQRMQTLCSSGRICRTTGRSQSLAYRNETVWNAGTSGFGAVHRGAKTE